MLTSRSEAIGRNVTNNPEILTSKELRQVLIEAWRSPFATRSDTARHNAEWIAIAAQLGLLTTLDDERWGRTWRITAAGLALLEDTHE